MSNRPFINFEEVKEKCPIPEVLDKLGILDQFTRKGDVLTGVCPIPLHKHGPKPNQDQFKIDRKRGLWLYKCFGDCSSEPYGGGDVIALVKAVKQLSDEHVRFWFADNFGDRLSTVKPGKQRVAKSEPEQADETVQPSAGSVEPLKPMSFYLNLKQDDVPYLTKRGVLPETIKRYGIGLCNKGMFNGYVTIPVYRWPKGHSEENPIGYIGRWPEDDFDEEQERPRYKIGFEASRVVYGLNEALAASNDQAPLIVVEGPFKVFHLVQCGYPNTVSTLTSSISDEQADILAAYGRQIILMFDGDEAGRNGMRAGAAKLITRTFVRVVKLEAGQEPDDLSGQQLKELLADVVR